MGSYIVNLSDNTIIAQYNAVDEEKVTGEWDVAPHYEPLVNACKSTLRTAVSKAQTFFFNH